MRTKRRKGMVEPMIDRHGITWVYAGDTAGWPYGERAQVDPDVPGEAGVTAAAARLWDRMCLRARHDGITIERIQMVVCELNKPEGPKEILGVSRYLDAGHPGVGKSHDPRHDEPSWGLGENKRPMMIPAAVALA